MKPTKERGPDKSVCFGYGTSDDVVLPYQCTRSNWYVYDGSKFVVESQVTCELVTPGSVPLHIQTLVDAAAGKYSTEKMALEHEVI